LWIIFLGLKTELGAVRKTPGGGGLATLALGEDEGKLRGSGSSA